MGLLRKAKNLAIKCENPLEESWIEHSEKVNFGILSSLFS